VLGTSSAARDLHRHQRLIQVRDQVVDMLDPDRQPHGVLRHP
jgi:hypothetical protein